MKPINKPVPTDKHGWVEYNNKVLIINEKSIPNVRRNDFKLQFNGTLCQKYRGTGVVHAEFVTDSPWFDQDRWYTAVKAPDSITFNNGIKAKSYSLNDVAAALSNAATLALGVDVLVESFEEAKAKVTINGKVYLMTWLNCD